MKQNVTELEYSNCNFDRFRGKSDEIELRGMNIKGWNCINHDLNFLLYGQESS